MWQLEKKNLVSNVPVVVEMGAGTIHANGMQMSNDGNTILFLNGVKARFNQTMTKETRPHDPEVSGFSLRPCASWLAALHGAESILTPVKVEANEMEIVDADKQAIFRGNVDAMRGSQKIAAMS